jgi:hypothetical protein
VKRKALFLSEVLTHTRTTQQQYPVGHLVDLCIAGTGMPLHLISPVMIQCSSIWLLVFQLGCAKRSSICALQAQGCPWMGQLQGTPLRTGSGLQCGPLWAAWHSWPPWKLPGGCTRGEGTGSGPLAPHPPANSVDIWPFFAAGNRRMKASFKLPSQALLSRTPTRSLLDNRSGPIMCPVSGVKQATSGGGVFLSCSCCADTVHSCGQPFYCR